MIIAHTSQSKASPIQLSASTPTTFPPYHSDSHVPSDKASNIHAVVKRRKLGLTALDGHIGLPSHTLDKLQVLQAGLKENCALLQESLSSHEALASPAYRLLPQELLGEIFLWCHPQTKYVTPSWNDCPLILTRVCRQWRAVALSTTRLWASLNVSLFKASGMSGGDLYKCWLEKARNVPLFIRVVHDMESTEPLLNTIEWLQPFLSQCIDLCWHGPPVQGLLDNSVQSLSRLEVISHKGNFPVSVRSPTPQLRSAVLRSMSYDPQSLHSIDFPWHQLLDLKIQFARVNSATILQVIGLCSQVQRIDVSCICINASSQTDPRSFPPTSVVNHSIHQLVVKFFRPGFDGLFAALTLPALEKLSICFCFPEGGPWPHEEFASFVIRSKCPLKWLTIHQSKGAKSHFAEYLKLLPGLKIKVR
jgi:hypothetical protein